MASRAIEEKWEWVRENGLKKYSCGSYLNRAHSAAKVAGYIIRGCCLLENACCPIIASERCFRERSTARAAGKHTSCKLPCSRRLGAVLPTKWRAAAPAPARKRRRKCRPAVPPN